MMSPKKMLCRDHGEADPCLICTHLRRGRALGFVDASARSDGVREVTCQRCASMLALPQPIAKSWAFLFGDRMRVCEHCLELIRIANERPPRAP
jgi:hypothetical protein